jgi:hypothetical protein
LTLLDGFLETRHRVDAQLLVEDHRLLRTQARHHGHRPYPGRNLRAQLLDGGYLSGLEEFDNLLCDRRANPRDRLQTLGVEARDVGMVSRHGPGRLLIGPAPERVPARDGEQVRILLEQSRDALVGPRHSVSLRTTRAGCGGLSAGR